MFVNNNMKLQIGKLYKTKSSALDLYYTNDNGETYFRHNYSTATGVKKGAVVLFLGTNKNFKNEEFLYGNKKYSFIKLYTTSVVLWKDLLYEL